jgi:hypothetical protein
MKDTTKERLIQLAKQDLANASDNLYRAKMAAQGRDTSMEWGHSGQSLQSIIDGYQEWHDHAAEVLRELGGSTAHEPMFTKVSA